VALPAEGGKRKDCHERALGLLAVRQRSRRELERRLLQAGFEPTEVADELGRLRAVGLIDDEAFARAVAEHGFGARKESRRMVAGKLATAGVDPATAQAVLEDLAGDDQERADVLAAQRASRLGAVPPDKAFARLAGYLARRGYPPAIARAAARRALAVEGVED
jgi:regulatory protein